MNLQLKLKEWQIVLLQWELANKEAEDVHVSAMRSFRSGEAYVEREWYRIRKERAMLRRRIAYLKRRHYLDRVQEGERILYKLTSKGKYEILRLQFVLHMKVQRNKKWNRRFYLAIFDIPEEKKKYRDFFRKLLKQNGFRMLQQSVWMTRYNPRPPIDALLYYLKLAQYFELMELNCEQCNPRLIKKIR